MAIALLSCGRAGEAAPQAVAPAVTVEAVAPPAIPPPVEEARWSVAGVEPGEPLPRVVERAPFETPCKYGKGHRRFAAFGDRACPFPQDTRVLIVGRAESSAPELHRVEAVAWIGSYLDDKTRPPRSTGASFTDRGSTSVELGEGWRAVRGADRMWLLVEGDVVRGHVVGEVPADPRHPTWAVVRRRVLRVQRPIPPCCSALRQRAAVAPPHRKGAYIAAAGACTAVAGSPQPDQAMAQVLAMLAGVDVPEACR